MNYWTDLIMKTKHVVHTSSFVHFVCFSKFEIEFKMFLVIKITRWGNMFTYVPCLADLARSVLSLITFINLIWDCQSIHSISVQFCICHLKLNILIWWNFHLGRQTHLHNSSHSVLNDNINAQVLLVIQPRSCHDTKAETVTPIVFTRFIMSTTYQK